LEFGMATNETSTTATHRYEVEIYSGTSRTWEHVEAAYYKTEGVFTTFKDADNKAVLSVRDDLLVSVKRIEVGPSEDNDGIAGRSYSDRDLDFGAALDALNDGKRLARDGWNGTGMFIVLQAGYPDGIPINANTARATGIAEGTVCKFRPYLMMLTAVGDFVPWVASQSDVLACDWRIIHGR
jgi:hypothetical protein